MLFARRALTAALFVGVLSAGAARAEKSLHWGALDVQARLDADGRLRVVERHAMVFTGDWNGGERSFRLHPGQQLSLGSVRRVDPATGAARELVAGNLAEVDHYGFTDATTLRWRSRLPSDPPFANTEIDTEIAYTLSGVLFRQSGVYLFDHNFGLPDAKQTIETLSVNLECDPVWAAPADFTSRRTTGPLPPGSNFVVRAELTHTGAGSPAAVRTGTSPSVRMALFGALLLAIGLMGGVFYTRESSLKRFGSPVALESIDAGWLEQNLFTLKPEEAGALWDDTVGAPEVTAVLARLTAEKKLETAASGKELTTRLKAPLTSFEGYEKDLLAALFFDKRTETSTGEIKEHYKSTGFDPAATIRPGLLQKLSAHSDFQDRSGRPPRWPTFLLFVAGLTLMALPAARGAVEWGTLVGAVISSGFWWVLALVGAMFYQRRMDRLGPWALSFLFVPLLFTWGAWRGVSSGGTSPLSILVGQLLLQLAIVNNLFNAAKTRQGPKKIARRRELVAARRFFEQELSRREPRMKDSWFPWVAAFGLGPAVDRWFRSFGGTAGTAGAVSGSSVSSSSSSGSSSFSGGGGRQLRRRRRGRLVKAKDGEPPVLMLPIRSPGRASAGSLSRLSTEFTDPGPAGDSLNMLKKYADGIVPGCMGLLFMVVGTVVIVLFSRQIVATDKKTYLPLVFGAVFALAGFLAGYFGIASVLRKAGGAAPGGREPWTSDNDWDPRGALPDNPTGTFLSFVGRVVFFLFICLLNILWTVRMDWTARAIVSVILVVFDLLALAILYDSFQKILQKIRIGTARLEWQKFPFFTGGRFDAVFRAGRAMRAPAAGTHAYEAWSAKKTIAALGAEPVTSFPISFEIPAEEPGTDLSRDDCVYWQLAVAVPVTGPDVEAVFLVPIYAPPK